MDLLLTQLDDLKSYRTTFLQPGDGRLVDVTNEFIGELEWELDNWMLELQFTLEMHRQQGGDFTV